MSEDEETQPKKTQWTKIGAGIAGGVLLALQGVNLSEVIGTADLVKRTEEAIERQGKLIKEINEESHLIRTGLENQRTIITNQGVLIDRVNTAIDGQTEFLKKLVPGELLEEAIEDQKKDLEILERINKTVDNQTTMLQNQQAMLSALKK